MKMQKIFNESKCKVRKQCYRNSEKSFKRDRTSRSPIEKKWFKLRPSSETFHRFNKCVNCWTFPCFEPKNEKMVHIFSLFFIRRYFSNNIRCVTILAYLNLRNQPADEWNCWVLQVRWLYFIYHEADKHVAVMK